MSRGCGETEVDNYQKPVVRFKAEISGGKEIWLKRVGCDIHASPYEGVVYRWADIARNPDAADLLKSAKNGKACPS